MSEAASEWTEIYQTRSPSDADLVRTTLEVAGYRVSVVNAVTRFAGNGPPAFILSVPTEDADDARQFLRDKTTFSPQEQSGMSSDTEEAPDTEKIEDAVAEVLDLRRQKEVAACKYCGIPTLDVSELDLESHSIALLRAAGLGVNSATFSEFRAGERICSDCAGHETSCDLCGRTLDAFIDEGEYRRARDDEAYLCVSCVSRLEGQLENERDW